MKAVVCHGVGDIRLDDVADPAIRDGHDAIVRITRSANCGTDLHVVRGTMSGMKEETILGHEAVGVVTEVGEYVRGFQPGDRVVINSTMSCGACSYCRDGHTAQCDVANPNGPQAGTCFFGGPETTGPVDGLGRLRPHPVGAEHHVEAARRRQRRAGDPPLRHLPDGLVRRPARRSESRRHRRRARRRHRRTDRRGLRHRRRPAGRPLAPRRRSLAGLALGGRDGQEVRPHRHHRRLPAGRRDVPHRPGHEREPHGPHGQLRSPQRHAAAHRARRLGAFDPTALITEREPLVDAIDAYEAFDRREPGWIKVALTTDAA